MINKLGFIAVISLSAYLFSCATAKPIPMGNDTYMISQTSALGQFICESQPNLSLKRLYPCAVVGTFI